MSTPTAGSLGFSTAHQGQVATITIDRGTQRHALTMELLIKLEARINQLANTPAQVIILRTHGDTEFSVVSDVPAVSQPPAVDMWRRWIPIGHRVFEQLANLPQPTIAIVDGLSIGGGAELALACDFRVATDDARIGPSGAGFGTIPGWGGTQRLTQLVGAARAKQIILAPHQIDAATAATWGLLTSVTPSEELEQHVDQLVGNLLDSSPVAQQIRQTNHRRSNLQLDSGHPEVANH